MKITTELPKESKTSANSQDDDISNVIDRGSIDIDWVVELLETESHHNHEIEEVTGVYRWRKDPLIDLLVESGDLNNIVHAMYEKGFDKNSEIYRELYRKMGYSLYGYWEVFYWDMNNGAAEDYKQPCL